MGGGRGVYPAAVDRVHGRCVLISLMVVGMAAAQAKVARVAGEKAVEDA